MVSAAKERAVTGRKSLEAPRDTTSVPELRLLKPAQASDRSCATKGDGAQVVDSIGTVWGVILPTALLTPNPRRPFPRGTGKERSAPVLSKSRAASTPYCRRLFSRPCRYHRWVTHTSSMADIVDRLTRSRMMSGITGRNTSPELAVRRYLHSRGLRFRIHSRGLPGRPDIVLRKYKTVVFVHGCFWHRHPGCRLSYVPKTRTDFWMTKFSENVNRDLLQARDLRNAGWRVLVIWGCEVTSERHLKKLLGGILRGAVEERSRRSKRR